MNNYPLVMTLGFGSLLAFFLFFIFYKVLHWSGKMASLTTAALMLLVLIPASITHWAGIDVFAIHFAFFMMIPYGLGIITAVHKERNDVGDYTDKKGLHWIPGLIIVFFILLAVVDSFIISSGTSGVNSKLAKWLLPKPASKEVSQTISSEFTGAVSNDHQDEEKRFDKYVLKLKQQRERGWQVKGKWDNFPPVVNKPATFKLTAKTKSGDAITGATVTTEFRRSSAMKHDRLVTFTEEGNGVYSTTLTLQLPGCWAMNVKVVKGSDEHEIKGLTEVAIIIDGKQVTPECIDGEPDVDDKYYR